MISIHQKKEIVSRGTLLFLFGILVFASCARMSSPTGGPKDETPPVPLQSKPANYSTNFSDDKIIILFDEYIVLKNVRSELLISPPLPEKAQVKQRGKSLVVKLNNELEDSTTYSLNFYNAIEDLNEGNKLPNFLFEFSTGPEFDSLYFAGTMKDAFEYNSQAGMYIILHENNNDSTPRTTIPKYVAKTNEEGGFFVPNLKNKSYYVYGLVDLNNNMLFDLPNEGIAFIDSAFSPGFELVDFTDTFKVVQTISANFKDTVWVDSIHVHQDWVSTIDDIMLLFFYEDSELQYFRNNYRTERKQVVFTFNREVSDSFSILPIVDTSYASTWFIREPQKRNDSIVLWLTDSVLYKKDSLQFAVRYMRLDSNKVEYLHTDTVLSFFEDKSKSLPEKEEKRSNKLNLGKFLGGQEEVVEEEKVIPSELTFTHNADKKFPLNKPIDLLARFPIAEVIPSLITLHRVEDDTVLIPVDFLFEKDSMMLKHYTIRFKKDEDEQFKLMISAGSFTDIYGNVNDTLFADIRTKSLSDYATIKLDIKNVFDHAVVQMINLKNNLLMETTIDGDTLLHYEYINPEKVVIKLYYDTNKNGKWDTGNLKEKRQPEQVFYFPQELELLKNMDYEYTWNLYPGME